MKRAKPSSLRTARLTARLATREDGSAIQACLESVPEYFVQAEGRPPDPDAAEQMIADAEADESRRVLVITVRESGAIIGVLDLHFDYPEPLVAQVGLLLFGRSSQGQGCGREIMTALESALERAGVHALRLAVVDENEPARLFWERLGFAAAGRLERGVTIYEKPLQRSDSRGVPDLQGRGR